MVPGHLGAEGKLEHCMQSAGTVRPTVRGLGGWSLTCCSVGGRECLQVSLQARGHGSWRCGQSQPDSRLGVNRGGRSQSPGNGARDSRSCVPGPAGVDRAGNQDLESRGPGQRGRRVVPPHVLLPFHAGKAKTVRRGHPQSQGRMAGLRGLEGQTDTPAVQGGQENSDYR